MRVRIPAALQLWAAERQDQLSDSTRREVSIIASTIAESSLGQRDISERGQDLPDALETLFPGERGKRAGLLIEVVAKWAEGRTTPPSAPPQAVSPVRPRTEPGPTAALPPDYVTGHPEDGDTPIAAPAFLGSDRVDEEDDQRLYGGDRSFRPWLIGLVVVTALLAGATWFVMSGETNDDSGASAEAVPLPSETSTDEPETDEAATEPDAATPAPTAAPAATAEPEALAYWADTTTILNSGSGEISASTYSVSAANRAVLTGHTAAITGIVVSNDGRVLTSGADMRLVDWGADVSLASPDVLNVSAPLTVLTRTVEQQIVAGDAQGNIVIIDLVDASAEPIVVAIHPAAISAITELSDGRLAVASVDGDVHVFLVETPEDVTKLGHDIEVTAVVGLDDGRIATAAVDGLVRLWPADGESDPETIDADESPLTAMIVLGDGRLVTGDVNGTIHVVAPEADATPDATLESHAGAVRALHEFELPSGEAVVASGGDDSDYSGLEHLD